MSSTMLFAYTAHISPIRMEATVPSAEFAFMAHLPETKLVFPIKDGNWNGGLPSIRAESGNTVWGAVFKIRTKELAALHGVEAGEGRIPSNDFKAVDREGRSHPVLTHVAGGDTDNEHTPSREYMEMVVQGARHWGLPTGWVAGLEEYVEEPLF